MIEKCNIRPLRTLVIAARGNFFQGRYLTGGAVEDFCAPRWHGSTDLSNDDELRNWAGFYSEMENMPSEYA